MRLAITGSAGVGKSTLAAALAAAQGVAHIDEHYDRFFDRPGKFSSAPQIMARLINEVLEHKHALETDAGAFVSDRCPIDLFNLWMTKGLTRYRTETTELYKKCVNYMQKYDYVIVLPWNAIPLTQTDESKDHRQRIMNPWVQFHNHSTIIGLAAQWVPSNRMLPIPRNVSDLGARMQYVVTRLSSATS